MSMLQAMKILDLNAAEDKEWEKLEKLPASWHVTKVKSKMEVILEAHEKKVHFAVVSDICHHKTRSHNQSTENPEDKSCSEVTL